MAGYKERLNALLGEDYDFSEETSVSLEGEILRKKGTIKFYRDDWKKDKVSHDLWTDSNRTVYIATDANRPFPHEDEVCHEAWCPIHKCKFIKEESGKDVDVDGKTIHGDLWKCKIGNEKFVSNLTPESVTSLKELINIMQGPSDSGGGTTAVTDGRNERDYNPYTK